MAKSLGENIITKEEEAKIFIFIHSAGTDPILIKFIKQYQMQKSNINDLQSKIVEKKFKIKNELIFKE